MKVLDVGCGKKKHPGSIGIDIRPDSDADKVCDFDKGIPYPDNSFDKVILHHSLEHSN
ncbi:MAG: methyltransferase type 11, partial [Candidatus Aenigmarchaeota archaeon]|nr:methyltransferase type 11 [Candidatus Aenigmarchaeota archaeon]